MAASATPTTLEHLLECSTCLNRFSDPRVLPCLHSCCMECLKSHVSSNKSSDGSFNCPECREKCIIPEGGSDKFPTNFFANSVKDVLVPALQEQRSKTTPSSDSVMCKYYEEDHTSKHGEAVMFCIQCDVNFCDVCSDHHELFDVTKEHTVTSVGGLNSDLQMIHEQCLNCEVHQSHRINWFCKTCTLPACADCMLESHKDHDTTNSLSLKLSEKQICLMYLSWLLSTYSTCKIS